MAVAGAELPLSSLCRRSSCAKAAAELPHCKDFADMGSSMLDPDKEGNQSVVSSSRIVPLESTKRIFRAGMPKACVEQLRHGS